MAIMQLLKRISDTVWEIPVSYKEGMLVPARIYGTEKLIQEMDEAVYDQVTNVATLPGITKYALCMPDGHFGYGFPIGGVAAMDVESGGVISPGGIGFDINCGMRLVVTNLTYVVYHVHTEVFCRASEYLRKNLTDTVQNDLTIGKRHVNAAIHRRKIVLPFGGVEGRTG